MIETIELTSSGFSYQADKLETGKYRIDGRDGLYFVLEDSEQQMLDGNFAVNLKVLRTYPIRSYTSYVVRNIKQALSVVRSVENEGSIYIEKSRSVRRFNLGDAA